MIEHLVGRGVDPNVADAQGVWAIQYATRRLQTRAVAVLHRLGARVDNLFDAVNAGDVARVQQLLASGADPNAKELVRLAPVPAHIGCTLTPSVVRSLTRHEAFNIKNPNRVRALIGAFGSGNPLHFHALDGSGYRLLGEYVRRLDAINPQVAARLATPFTQWRRYDEQRQSLMQAELESIAAVAGLSRDVLEIVSKTLA